MATIVFQAHHARPSGGGRFSVVFHLTGEPDPFPRREFETTKTAEALAAFEEYKKEAAASGLPIAATIRVKNGSRAPNGFNDASRNPYYHGLNIEG